MTSPQADSSRRSQLAEAEQQRQRAEVLLGNLLARIFRDGGHRQAEFATLDEAVEAADTLCAEYIAGIEQRQWDVTRARADQRQDDIETMCRWCADGWGATRFSGPNDAPIWVHIQGGIVSCGCDAAKLRERVRALEEPKA